MNLDLEHFLDNKSSLHLNQELCTQLEEVILSIIITMELEEIPISMKIMEVLQKCINLFHGHR